jgi:hypothetical protein
VQNTRVELVFELYGGQDEEKPGIFQISGIENVRAKMPEDFGSRLLRWFYENCKKVLLWESRLALLTTLNVGSS